MPVRRIIRVVHLDRDAVLKMASLICSRPLPFSPSGAPAPKIILELHTSPELVPHLVKQVGHSNAELSNLLRRGPQVDIAATPSSQPRKPRQVKKRSVLTRLTTTEAALSTA
jgi:hypothetical protein